MNIEKIYPEERLIKIMELLKKKSKVEVEKLTEYFQVTGSTIRADLRELENRNLILRTHGGAMLKEVLDESLKTDRDPAYEKLKKSILEFDYIDPLIWNERTGRVVGGHQRLKVLKDLGREKMSKE